MVGVKGFLVGKSGGRMGKVVGKRVRCGGFCAGGYKCGIGWGRFDMDEERENWGEHVGKSLGKWVVGGRPRDCGVEFWGSEGFWRVEGWFDFGVSV